MRLSLCVLFTLGSLLVVRSAIGDELIFEDNFKDRLSDKWQIVGLKDSDYRIRNGGLEIRVQPGKLTKQTPMLKVMFPITSANTVYASVKITVLDDFTEEGESAGLYLVDESGTEFSARKERKDKKLIYAPGEVVFKGKDGEEDDFTKYEDIIVNESAEAGPVRILVDRGDAFFQVGPSTKGTYLNHFYSAIRPTSKGFALTACGAPKEASHWVRFENFKVAHRR